MSVEYNEAEQKLIAREVRNKYMRERTRNETTLVITPAKTKQLKIYYDEYITTCQQNQFATVNFHDFILQYCEIGFFSWRDRNKMK